jgi:UDP-N-acetylmuramoyl-tripeptide--D-alanyl-D-alanine ligase
MIRLDIAAIAAAVDGALHDVPDAAAVVGGPVVVDSREVVEGALFVAVKGERTDGHAYAVAAAEAGAVLVLAARPVGVPAVVVDDPVAAMGRLARAVLDRLGDVTVIGVTGSSGKTSTKDLLAQVLETAGSTVAPKESFNNEIGVPLTVLAADDTTRHLVVEMGARGAGHIAQLCRIAPPRISVVLNIGSAHAGEFGDRAATAAAKREIVTALPGDGVAVLNADDPLVLAMAAAAPGRVVTFGTAPDADVRAESVVLDPAGRAAFDLVTATGRARVQLLLVGAHQVSNALATAAVAGVLRVPVDSVAAALSSAGPRSRWRMEVTERSDGVTVVNDAYNANPESVAAALHALASIAAGRRSWAVLGEMLELGAASDEEHEAVGRLAVRLGVDRVVAVGDGARGVFRAARDAVGASVGEEPVLVADGATALDLLRAELRSGDVVLVKASRRAGLERVAQGLTEEVPA